MLFQHSVINSIRIKQQREFNMNKSMNLIAVLIAVLISTQAIAATSEIKWVEPDKYRDIDAGEESKMKFRERVFTRFEKHFNKLADKLPEGQVLKIEVTDLDLAGSTLHGGMKRIRVIKSIHFPRIDFSYQLVDATGAELKSANVELKDMNFMMGSNLRYRNDFLGYEKKLLDDWFKKEFSEETVKKQ